MKIRDIIQQTLESDTLVPNATVAGVNFVMDGEAAATKDDSIEIQPSVAHDIIGNNSTIANETNFLPSQAINTAVGTTPQRQRAPNAGIVVAGVATGLVLVFVAFIVAFVRKKRSKNHDDYNSSDRSSHQSDCITSQPPPTTPFVISSSYSPNKSNNRTTINSSPYHHNQYSLTRTMTTDTEKTPVDSNINRQNIMIQRSDTNVTDRTEVASNTTLAHYGIRSSGNKNRMGRPMCLDSVNECEEYDD